MNITRFLSLLLLASATNFIEAQTSGPTQAMPISDLQLFRYQGWEIKLPADWRDKSDSPNQVYLESGDQTKGLYCMSIGYPPTTQGSPEKALKVMVNMGRKARESMTGFSWVQTSPQKEFTENGVIQYSDEYFDKSKMYAITTIIFAGQNTAVRITIHNYACIDLKASREYFSIPISSLNIRSVSP